ncbi:MAG: DUF349 domain-containing protein [Flavobacteriales bacterium]|nr:DUF349 domain-containing protein [Flavobacteriales bacterium]
MILHSDETENSVHPVNPPDHSAKNPIEEHELHDNSSSDEIKGEDASEKEALAELEEEIESYDNHDASSLAKILHEVLQSDRIREFRKQFNVLKKRFRDLLEEEKNKLYSAYLEDGGKPEDFFYTPSEALNKLKDGIRKYSDRLNEIRKKEEQQLQANFLAKQDVVHELKNLITEESDIKKAFEKFHTLREKWSSIGPVPANLAEELWKNYKFYSDKFYEFVQINKELYEVELKKNLEIKQHLIRRTEGLLKMPSIQKSIELLHSIQKEWRETGPVPKEHTKSIFEKFKETVQKVYERRDDFLKAREAERQKNLEIKTALCEKMEAIASVNYKSLPEWKKNEIEVQNLDEAWKKTGRVPEQYNESIWERFKLARREFYKKKHALLKQIQEELKQNYEKKVKLCEKAEALQHSTDWKNTTHQLLNLQNEWKKIGPVERKKSDEIWARFRAACDTFFHAKEQYFAGQSDREAANLEAKKALIEKINTLVPAESIEENLQLIKSLQQEWNEIGFVPVKEKNAIEKSFQQALNGLMAKMNMDQDKRFRMEYKLKLEQMLQAPNAEALLKEERTYVGNRIRKLQDEITQIENNLGFFKHAKDADQIRKQYEGKIESLKNEVSHLEEKRQLIKNAFQKMGK